MTDTVDSASLPTVVQALAAVMAEVQAVGKDGTNTQQGYSFRGIDGVMNAVGPALRKHGVVIVPTLEDATYRDVEVGRNRTLMREVTVRVRYTVHGPAGDTLEGVVIGESMDSGDKGTAKAFSVAYRTFLLQALTIPTHQPDPDEQTYERATAAPRWEVGHAKQALLAAVGGDKALAAEAWTDLRGDDRWPSWEHDWPAKEIEEWLNQPADDPAAPTSPADTDTTEEGGND